MPAPIEEPDFELLPGKSGEPDVAGILAHALDDLIPIPFTKMRIGLDPIIALIPGLGDASTAAMGSLILVQSFRLGVPKIIILRMAANILLNALISAVPGIGPVVSAWFKSNSRNHKLLLMHSNPARPSTLGDWIFLGALGATLGLGLIVSALAALWMTVNMIRFLAGIPQ